MKEFIQLVLAQFREFYRQPGVIFWTLMFPVLMAWGLGIAFTGKKELVKHVAWVKEDAGQHAFDNFLGDKAKAEKHFKTLGNEKTGFTTYHFSEISWKEAELMIKRGEAALIIHEKNDSVNYYFDPDNPEAQLSYLQISSAFHNGKSLDESGSIYPLSKKGMRYIDFLVPGLMAMNIMMSGMWGISYNLIDKRSKKLLRRMVATPMNKRSFLFSHLVSRLTLSLIESLLLLGFAWMYFDISLQGSIPALACMLISGNIAFFGLAVLVSSRTSNTQIGNGMINVVVMPMMICSGIFFSYHNFPDQVIRVIQKLPLTVLADGVRSIFIEGAGFAETAAGMLLLSLSGILFLIAGMRIYKWY